jgi:CheY-like chemotaxis protein
MLVRCCARSLNPVRGNEAREVALSERAYAGVLMPNQILIVDSNAEDAVELEQLLRRKCVANPIRELTDGLVAMDYLLGKSPYGDRDAHPFPAAIFMELALPGRSGLEILAWLNEHSEVPRPRIIIYTRETGHVELENAYLLGADAILIKQTLREQISGVIAQISEVWVFGDPKKTI